MNIDNLNKLIAHMEAQPPEQIDMASVGNPQCGTPGCIVGHSLWVFKNGPWHPVRSFADAIDLGYGYASDLAHPEGFMSERYGFVRYPAHRVIATLKRLRDTYLATGQVVVDWGPEPVDEPKTPWIAPQIAEVIAPALPAEITSLLRPSAVKTEA
jgi:hypothetical protein